MEKIKRRQTKSKSKLKANPICECCSTLSNLDIHHINYKSLYNVDLSDLKTLCRKCHNEEHKNINKHKVTFPKKQFRLTLRCCKETSGYNILFNIFNSLTPNVYLIKWILNNLNEQLIIPSGRRGISKANKRRINGE